MYSVYKRLHNVISLAAEKHAFSAKERDVETGLSYFGARYYSSDLSIWLSVDPMADKYPSMSPYTYCANNPVKLVDPEGEEIVGTDGKPASYSYDNQGNIIWSDNTSDDAKRIGNALLKTRTGKEQLDKLISTSTKVSINIMESSSNKDVMGDAQYISSSNYDGTTPLVSATINIYESSIKDYLGSGDFETYSSLGFGTLWASQDKDNGVETYMAAVAGHEIEHIVSKENRILTVNAQKHPSSLNAYFRELIPNLVKTNILWESYLK